VKRQNKIIQITIVTSHEGNAKPQNYFISLSLNDGTNSSGSHLY